MADAPIADSLAAPAAYSKSWMDDILGKLSTPELQMVVMHCNHEDAVEARLSSILMIIVKGTAQHIIDGRP